LRGTSRNVLERNEQERRVLDHVRREGVHDHADQFHPADDLEVPGDPVRGHPPVQALHRIGVRRDRLFLERPPGPVVHGPEIALEFRERRLPVS
jgi:hypothetical protein